MEKGSGKKSNEKRKKIILELMEQEFYVPMC